MATLTKGTTFASGDVVTPAKLNNLVDAATVSNIVNADISASAAISLSKLATGALPAGITIASANIVDGAIATAGIANSAITSDKIANSAITSAKIADGTIVNADINTSAAISHNKLANISSGQVLLGNASNIPTATTLSGDVTINSLGVTTIGAGIIYNANINAAAEIIDSKLATISTSGKVSNSATTATSANTASAIVARDASGNFSAGTITATLSGNATTATTSAACAGNSSTATAWQTARNLALTGDVTATLSSVNGSANVSATASISNNSVTTAKIADANVTTAKIADANVTNAKFARSVGLNAWQTLTANYTAESGDRINANTSVGEFTITLPATPANYTEVTLADHAGTWESKNLTVAGNGSNINGGTANLTCDIAAKQILLRFEGATIGWRIYT